MNAQEARNLSGSTLLKKCIAEIEAQVRKRAEEGHTWLRFFYNPRKTPYSVAIEAAREFGRRGFKTYDKDGIITKGNGVERYHAIILYWSEGVEPGYDPDKHRGFFSGLLPTIYIEPDFFS